MSDSLETIEANIRKNTGKGYARKLRKNGKVPAVLLEAGKSMLLEFDPKLLAKAYKGSNKKFNLSLDGNVKEVVIKELQIDKIKRTVLHVDLMYTK